MATQNFNHPEYADSELTDEYKNMIDEMLKEEENGTAEYVDLTTIKDKYLPNNQLLFP